jgi:hypothetical protein
MGTESTVEKTDRNRISSREKSRSKFRTAGTGVNGMGKESSSAVKNQIRKSPVEKTNRLSSLPWKIGSEKKNVLYRRKDFNRKQQRLSNC